MSGRRRFPASVLARIREAHILGLRAGRARPPHRIIGIWAVVVDGRVFVRSWSLKPRSWWRTFQEDPEGLIVVEGGRRLRVRAVATRGEKLEDRVSRAYREKYTSPGSVRFAKDMGRKKSRETTTELVPLSVLR